MEEKKPKKEKEKSPKEDEGGERKKMEAMETKKTCVQKKDYTKRGMYGWLEILGRDG